MIQVLRLGHWQVEVVAAQAIHPSGIHLEPWQCSISYVKHTIFVYYDIDSILTRYRTSENDVRYRDTILNSISNIKNSISMHYDIEESIDIEPFVIDIDS